MYLSKLILSGEPGARRVHRDLANPYEMHRTVLRAFPGKNDGGPGRVLWRVEPTRPGCPPVVLVQSDKPPDWTPLKAIPDYLLLAKSKQFALAVRAGRKLRFRLRANCAVKRGGKRHGRFKYEDQCDWLRRKGQAGGFIPLDFAVTRWGELASWRTGEGKSARQTHFTVDFEGVLEVLDAERFAAALAAGIGPGKAFGFGLLSVAPVRDP